MKPVVQKNRTFYGGVVLTVLEGLLSGCTFLSIFLLLRMLAEGTVTRGGIWGLTGFLAGVFALRLLVYGVGYSEVQIGGAGVSMALRLGMGDKLKRIPLPRFHLLWGYQFFLRGAHNSGPHQPLCSRRNHHGCRRSLRWRKNHPL